MKYMEKVEEVEKENFLELLGFKYISGGFGHNLQVTCKEGHVFNRAFDRFNKSSKCPVCNKEEQVNYLKSLGFTKISDCLGTKLEVQCERGHKFKRPFSKFNTTSTCPECDKLKIINRIESLGYSFLSSQIVNKRSIATVKCFKGHVFSSSASNFYENKVLCPDCNKTFKEEQKQFVEDLGYTVLDSSNSNKFKVKCNYCNFEFIRGFSDFKRGTTSCTNCNKLEKHKYFNTYGFIILNEDFKTSEIKIMCKNNHMSKIAFNNINTSKPYICQECVKTIRLQEIRELGFEVLDSTNIKNLLLECSEGHIFNRSYFVFDSGSTVCPICSDGSSQEKEVKEFLTEYNINHVSNDWSILGSKEIDIFIPEYNLAIEIDGIYWHSEKSGKIKDYHLNKTEKCLSKGIQLFHIFENEWINQKDIWKSIILRKLDKLSKIPLENTRVEIVDLKDEQEFLNKNHLKGYVESDFCYGLYYLNELVYIMSFKIYPLFGSQIEILRYTSKNYLDIDGFNILFKHFISNNSLINKVVVLSDRRYHNNSVYKNADFLMTNITEPNVLYFRGLTPILKEDANEKCHKLWDCGDEIWEYNKEGL